MTFADLWAMVDAYNDNHPEQRRGQVWFNVMAMLSPVAHLAEEVRGTDRDPFYDDDRLPAFLHHVQERM